MSNVADIEITVRAKAFSGCGVERVRCLVSDDGTVRVHDPIAGYYTHCHALSVGAQRRIRRLATQGGAS